MSHIRRLDHVGITVADLDAATASFADHQPGSPTATADELGQRSI